MSELIDPKARGYTYLAANDVVRLSAILRIFSTSQLSVSHFTTKLT
jgi:hypothetical protein